MNTKKMENLSNDEWKAKLTSEQYRVTREKGTEAPFSSEFIKHNDHGEYLCICCNSELFSSDSKFESACGWPAFSSAIKNEQTVVRVIHQTSSKDKIEVTCKSCGAHLGHLFNDKHSKTGIRFCINGVALKFVSQNETY